LTPHQQVLLLLGVDARDAHHEPAAAAENGCEMEGGRREQQRAASTRKERQRGAHLVGSASATGGRSMDVHMTCGDGFEGGARSSELLLFTKAEKRARHESSARSAYRHVGLLDAGLVQLHGVRRRDPARRGVERGEQGEASVRRLRARAGAAQRGNGILAKSRKSGGKCWAAEDGGGKTCGVKGVAREATAHD
jgi:hypothetical protein